MEDRHEYLKIQSLRKALEDDPTDEELRNVSNCFDMIDKAKQTIRELFKHLRMFEENLKNYDSIDMEEFHNRSSQLNNFNETLKGMMKLWNDFKRVKDLGYGDRLMCIFLNRKEFRESEERRQSICEELKKHNDRFQGHKIANEKEINNLFERIRKLTAWHKKVLHLIETEHNEHVSVEISTKQDKIGTNSERISMDEFRQLASSFVPSVSNVFNNYGQMQYNKGNNLGDPVFGNKYNTRIDSLFDIQGNYYNRYIDDINIDCSTDYSRGKVTGNNNDVSYKEGKHENNSSFLNRIKQIF